GFVLTLMHLGIAGVTDEWAQRFAYGLIAIGAVAIVYPLGKSMLSTAVHDWRIASENQHLIAGAAGVSLLILGLVAIYVLGKPQDGGAPTDQHLLMARWGRIGAMAGGFLLLLALLRSSPPGLVPSRGWGEGPPKAYLAAPGFALIPAGVAYLAIGIGFISENRLVVLTRRELTAYFVSPIVYFVMLGFVV